MAYKSFPQKKERNTAKKIFVFTAFFTLALFSFFPSLFVDFSGRANTDSVPLWNSKENFSSRFSNFFSLGQSKQSLLDQNEKLSLKIAELQQKVSGYDFVIQKNLELEKFFFQKPEGYIFARVISRPNVSLYDTFILDAGKDAGIKKGAKVASQSMMVIGEIEEVYANSSKAKSFSSAGNKTGIFLGPENIPLEMYGMGGGSFYVDVPSGVDVADGDSAVLAENAEFTVAYVISEDKNTNDSFHRLYLQSPSNLFVIKYAQIEKLN